MENSDQVTTTNANSAEAQKPIPFSYSQLACKGVATASFFYGVPVPPGQVEDGCNFLATALHASINYSTPKK